MPRRVAFKAPHELAIATLDLQRGKSRADTGFVTFQKLQENFSDPRLVFRNQPSHLVLVLGAVGGVLLQGGEKAAVWTRLGARVQLTQLQEVTILGDIFVV